MAAFRDILKKLAYLISSKQKKQYVVVTFLAMIGSMFELLGVTAILPFVEAIMMPEELEGAWYYRIINNLFHPKTNLQTITIIGICIILVYVVKNVYLMFSSYVQSWYSTSVQRDLSIRVFNVFLRSSYLFHLGTNSSVLIRTINQDVVGVFAVFFHLFRVMAEAFTIIAIGVYIITLDPIMALCLGVLMGGCLFFIFVGLKKLIKRYGRIGQSMEGKMFQYLSQAFNGIKEIQVMNRQEYFADSFTEACTINASNAKKGNFVNSMPQFFYEMICMGGLIGIVVLRLHMVSDVTIFVTKLATIAVAAFRLFPSVSRLNTSVNAMIYNRSRLDSMYEMVKMIQDESHYQNLKKTEKQPKLKFEEKLSVEGVTWKYPLGEKPVFTNLSMELKKGESVAFVGPSGAGKTTLADVILGLLEPQEGKILLDDQDVYKNLPGWSKVVGYVPQAVFLTDDTIRNNVAFGVYENEIDDEKVWKALEESQLAPFIRKLPDGLDTMVGERGVRLSGGQRQRIAIARALYDDPDILILDEATSALDTETETAVMESIDSLHGNKTMIIVAHRLTTIRNCDRIYQISDGTAVQKDKAEILGDLLNEDNK